MTGVPVRITGIGFMALGLFIGLGAVRLGIGGWHSPGPGFLPLWIGAGMIVLGTMLVLAQGRDIRPLGRYPGLMAGKLTWAVALLAGYALVLERLGFLPTTLLFVLLWLRSIERASWAEAILMAVASTAAVYGVFARWLQVPLPAGVLAW